MAATTEFRQEQHPQQQEQNWEQHWQQYGQQYDQPSGQYAYQGFQYPSYQIGSALYPAARSRRHKRRTSRRRSFFEVLLNKIQQPEVILLGVWWLIMLCLVVHMAEMGDILQAIWRPLAILLSIPLLFFVLLSFATL